MKIKSILIAVFLFIIFVNKVFAQNKVECEKIVIATVEAINNKTPEQLEKFLAPDFTFSGQKAPLAGIVLNQLLKQLGDEVAGYQKIDETENNEELTLVYEFSYAKKLGQRTTTFVFNKDNQLKQLELLTLQIKTMEKDEAPSFEKSEQKIITVPIQIKNNLPLVQATVNGESRMFFFDSGTSRSVFNSRYFRSFKDNETSISTAQGVNTSISGMDIIQIKDFDFYGIKFKESKALTMDLSHLEEACDAEIYGLIGYEVFKDYDILFDYGSNTLTLIQPSETKTYFETNYKRSKIETIPVEMRGHIPTVKGKIGKTEFIFGIDCGAGGNVLDEKFYVSMKKNLSNLENTDLSGAGETRNVPSGNLKEITIGKKKFKNILTTFNDISHLNTGEGIQMDGLAGYEILSKQKVLLRFQDKQLIFID